MSPDGIAGAFYFAYFLPFGFALASAFLPVDAFFALAFVAMLVNFLVPATEWNSLRHLIIYQITKQNYI